MDQVLQISIIFFLNLNMGIIIQEAPWFNRGLGATIQAEVDVMNTLCSLELMKCNGGCVSDLDLEDVGSNVHSAMNLSGSLSLTYLMTVK